MIDSSRPSRHRGRRDGASIGARVGVLVFVTTSLVFGCALTRDGDSSSGVHPTEWVIAGSPEFHGSWLTAANYPLGQCRTCHGDDYRGGEVGVGCDNLGCHPGGVERCGTCHGYADDPLPETGSHLHHSELCAECHPVPAIVDSYGHVDGAIDLVFTGVAATGGLTPQWSRSTDRCSNTYCHGDSSPEWHEGEGLECVTCHTLPPPSHFRFVRVAPQNSCDNCHPGSELDGLLQLEIDGCDSCHGTGNGAPPIALNGDTSPEEPSVGAHQRHVDPAYDGRIGRAARCDQCHPVPAAVTDQGHIDRSSPADVILPRGGSYQSGSQSCTVWCHWDRDPGPSWTDTSGDELACDACHGFPPVETRVGTPHPAAIDPEVDLCRSCHLLTPSRHVDGIVDFQWDG